MNQKYEVMIINRLTKRVHKGVTNASPRHMRALKKAYRFKFWMKVDINAYTL